MSKRAQERKTEEEPVVAKPKPVSLVSTNLSAKQSSSLDSGASYSPGIKDWVGTLCSRALRDRCKTESKTQQCDLKSGKETKIRFQETGARNPEPTFKDEVGLPRSSNFRTIYVLKKVFTNVRQKLDRSEGDQMLDQQINVLIWDYLC